MQTTIKTRYILLFSMILIILFDTYFRSFLLTRDIFYDFYAEQLSIDQIENFLNSRDEWAFLSYIILPLIYLIKISLTAICVYTGIYFYQNEGISLKDIIRIVIKADLVFFIPALIKLLWFSFINTNFSLVDFQYFMPISLLSIFEVSQIEKWLIYPLQTLNIFELVFWLLLGYQLKPLLKKDFSESLKLILASYGSGLMIWIIFVVFFVVNLT